MSSAMAYIKVEEALKKPGCPLCHIVQEASIRYLDGLLYESEPWGREKDSWLRSLKALGGEILL